MKKNFKNEKKIKNFNFFLAHVAPGLPMSVHKIFYDFMGSYFKRHVI